MNDTIEITAMTDEWFASKLYDRTGTCAMCGGEPVVDGYCSAECYDEGEAEHGPAFDREDR